MSQFNPNPSTMEELARVGLLFIVVWCGGALVAATASMSQVFRGISSADVVGMLMFGAFAGHLSAIVYIVFLWRKPIWRTLLWVYGPTCMVAFATGLALGAPAAILSAPLIFVIACGVAFHHLPTVFPTWQAGACLTCGYDLRGLRSGRCPECGQEMLPLATTSIHGQEGGATSASQGSTADPPGVEPDR